MTLVLAAIGLLLASGLLALALPDRAALRTASVTCALACALGVGASGAFLLGGAQAPELQVAWPVPVGELRLGLDSLSAFFLLCLFLVCGLAAVYGAGYLDHLAGKRRLGPLVFFANLLVAAMATVVLARDGVLFLVAWEVMSIAGFFAVTFDHEREEVRRAGMVYLIASHVGVVFLLVLFALLARHAGDFSWSALAERGAPGRDLATACFLLAVVGFGSKAGFWLLHIWLPDAHPAAPSPVSAAMSGAMIKLGIYGLLRTLSFLGPPPAWWGALLLAVGAVSGLAAILHALAQHDLKRLLAYSSIENVGIITIGLGLGLLGESAGRPAVAALGFGGALFHVLAHGLMKGLLFQAAGSVNHATGTRAIDSLGGLLRRMPTTGTMFLVGALAISGLPPLCGFAGEFIIYVAAFRGGHALPDGWAGAAVAAIPALALIGGLAAATFMKAFGVAFLGEPRTPAAAGAHESTLAERAAMLVGAALCLAIGAWPAGALRLVLAPLRQLVAADPRLLIDAAAPLVAVTRVAAVLAGLVAGLAGLRALLLHGRPVAVAPTWGCGYEAPSARMQYTGSSFGQPIGAVFSTLTQKKTLHEPPAGYFPTGARYEEQPGDIAGERVIVPAARRFLGALARLRVIQHGRVQLYLVYVMVTLLLLLGWQLSRP